MSTCQRRGPLRLCEPRGAARRGDEGARRFPPPSLPGFVPRSLFTGGLAGKWPPPYPHQHTPSSFAPSARPRPSTMAPSWRRSS
eukprot:2837337-Prymnesium_polylepis.2